MEEEKQEQDLSTCISPIVKRRSSLFSKRLSGGNCKQSETVQEVENGDSPKENGCAEAEITLKEYVAKLHQERKDWKTVKQARKKRMIASKMALASGALVLKWEENQDFLTDEDKRFIAQLPDYSIICQKLDEAEQNLYLYEHNRNKLVQAAMYLVDRLDVKTTVDGTSDNTVEKTHEL